MSDQLRIERMREMVGVIFLEVIESGSLNRRLLDRGRNVLEYFELIIEN